MNLRVKNKRMKYIIIFLLFIITLGYALLSSSVRITGVSKIYNPTWNVHFDNIQVRSGSVEVDSENYKEATIDDPNTVSYAVKLNKPGDFYEFNVDVVNEGTIDAMVKLVESKIKIGEEEKTILELPKWLLYNVSYEDGSKIEENHGLLSGEVETYKVRVEYNKDLNNDELPS